MTSQKVVPPLKGGRTSDTIKGPSRKKESKLFHSEKRVANWSLEQWLTKPSEGVSGHPVRTSFAGLAEVGTILDWKQASIWQPRGSLGRKASTLAPSVGTLAPSTAKMSTPSRSHLSAKGDEGYFEWREAMERRQLESKRQMQALF